MTDLDPLATPPREGSELQGRVAREPGVRADGMEGPTGHAATTESVGDPEQDSVASGGTAGAGAGALAGTAVAGPVGAVVGAAAGAVAGAGAEAVDEDSSTNEPGPMTEPGSEGTVTSEPGREAMGDRHPAGAPGGEPAEHEARHEPEDRGGGAR